MVYVDRVRPYCCDSETATELTGLTGFVWWFRELVGENALSVERIDSPYLDRYRGADPSQVKQVKVEFVVVDVVTVKIEQLTLYSDQRIDKPVAWRSCGFGDVRAVCCAWMEVWWMEKKHGLD